MIAEFCCALLSHLPTWHWMDMSSESIDMYEENHNTKSTFLYIYIFVTIYMFFFIYIHIYICIDI